MAKNTFALGSVIDAGGTERAVTSKGYISLITGDVIQELDPRWKVKLIRRPFGLQSKED